MTTHTIPTTARAGTLPPSLARGSLTFEGVLRSEWIKLMSLRSIRWLIVVMLGVSWLGALLLSVAVFDTETVTGDALPGLIAQSATFSSNLTVLIMGVLGVLAITNEYTSGLVLSSLAAVPRRTPMLAAKALVVASVGLVVGALSTFGGALIAATIAGPNGFAALGSSEVLLSLLGTVLFLTLAALMSLGIGALLRSSAGAISVIVVLLFVSTLVFQLLLVTGWAWVPDIAQWLPADLGNQLATAPLMGSDTPAQAMGVGYWAALGGLAAWAAVALVPAAILLKTRDAV